MVTLFSELIVPVGLSVGPECLSHLRLSRDVSIDPQMISPLCLIQIGVKMF